MIHGVVFDLGETLIQFEGAWPDTLLGSQEALTRALEAEGIRVNREEFHKDWRAEMEAAYDAREADETERPTRDLLAGLLRQYGYPDVPAETLARCLAAMYAVSEKQWVPIPEAQPVLKSLQGSYRLGAISNAGDSANAHHLFDKTGLGVYFDPILISADFGVRKPSPRLFHLLIRQWGFAPETLVMVGDTLRADVLGAQRVGMHQIWLATQADRPDNQAAAEQVHPELTVTSLTQVPELVRALDAAS
jgi:HAD superfamily hydrolase (TIGR01549 family)